MILYISWHSEFEQVRRVVSRSKITSLDTSRLTTKSSLISNFLRRSFNSSACLIVLGKPSRINPFSQSGSCRRASMIFMISESGTRSPRSIYPLAFLPSSVPAFTAARRISPVEICIDPSKSQRNLAIVPLPAPGAPKSIILI